ncbi:hypothetical protein AUP68_06298 [Ilyonectria robusta]
MSASQGRLLRATVGIWSGSSSRSSLLSLRSRRDCRSACAFSVVLAITLPSTTSSGELISGISLCYWISWETRKTKLGTDHPDTLTSMGNLASIYRNQSRLEEAEKLFVQVMEACKSKLGGDYPDTLASMANLSFTWRI